MSRAAETAARDVAAALSRSEIGRPVLVVDHDRLMANIAYLDRHLPRGYARRIVDKSLPCAALLELAMRGLGTRRVMSFDLGITAQTLAHFGEAEILMGKPVTTVEIARFLAENPRAGQVTWLVDSASRAEDLAGLAARFGPLSVAAEVDIGLGRGGFVAPEDLAVLRRDGLRPVALMGYEAHVNALPRLLGRGARAMAAAMARLEAFRAALPEAEIVNTGGSSTALMLPQGGPGNELSIGSALLKPSDFDLPLNDALEPALFLAAPVLKTAPHGLAGQPRLSAVLRKLGVIAPRISFVHGGKWMAAPVWPTGWRPSPFYGPSSNQQGFAHHGPGADWLVLWPSQSEAVILHAPELHVLKAGALVERWPSFERV